MSNVQTWILLEGFSQPRRLHGVALPLIFKRCLISGLILLAELMGWLGVGLLFDLITNNRESFLAVTTLNGVG